MTDVDSAEEIDELLGERVVVSIRHGGNTTGTVTDAYDQSDGTMYVVELDDAGDAHMTADFLKPVDDVDVGDEDDDGPGWLYLDDIRCTECDVTGMVNISGPEPPDPDRHGMGRTRFKCPLCGERGTEVFPMPGSHGPTFLEAPPRFERIDDGGGDGE